MTDLNIQAILEQLPHRYPFLLIDRVLEYTKDESLVAIKNVTINEPFFQGHFPHYPVMPGVLIIESMAQASAILAGISSDVSASPDRIYLFAGVDKARFKRQVEPGDQLRIEAKILRKLKGIWKCEVKTSVDGQLCSSAELLFTHRDL